MATDNHTNHFSAADIERYHKGLLPTRERHALEKAALDDPFLADALEGYATSGVNMAADLAELKKRLAEKTEGAVVVPMPSTRRTFSPALRVAAMLILLVGAGLLVYQFGFNNKKADVADNRTVKEEAKKQDTSSINISPSSTATTPVKPEADALPSTQGNNAGPTTPAKAGGTKPVPGTTGTITTGATGEVKTVTVNDRDVAAETKTDIKTAPVASIPAKAKDNLDEEKQPTGTERGLDREDVKTRSVAKPAAKESGGKAPVDDKTETSITANPQAGANEKDYYSNRRMNTFRGRVTDANNTGVPFANVTNIQDNVGTYTDANGNFTLTSTDSVLNVQIRSLGYDNNQTQLRNDISSNKVVMQEDRRSLSEVVLSTHKPNTVNRSKDANRKLIEPEPVDGWEKYDSYLANNINVPEDFNQQKTTATNSVQVSFEVDKNGEPTNIRVEKSLCSACDQEAIRLVKEGPKFKRNANKKGRTTVTINF